jgi:hypothetical protein
MAHGREDWAGTAQISGLWGVSDLGELAARLGTLSTLDRRGNVAWADGFENGLGPWQSETVGAGATVKLTGNNAYAGGLAALLTGGSDSTRRANIYKTYLLPAIVKIGLECMVSVITTDVDYFQVQLRYTIGGVQRNAKLILDITNTLFKVLDTAGNIIYSRTLSDRLFNAVTYHLLKIVIDISKHTLIRASFDELDIDLEEVANPAGTADTKLGMLIGCYCFSNVGVNGQCKVDNVILTYNEP